MLTPHDTPEPATGTATGAETPHSAEAPPGGDPLARERAHLAASRAALRAMREDVESLDLTDVTANWVNAAVLNAQIEERIKSLADLSHTPLFFGRLDYVREVSAGEEGTAPDGPYRAERFYIGRRHVHDPAGDPMVIDWRAPVSQPFYQASRTNPWTSRCAAASATPAATSPRTRTRT